MDHFINRASQREKMEYEVYFIHKHKIPKALNEALPEPVGENWALIPDDTYVLIACYKRENWDWIIKSALYNARADNKRGSLRLGSGEAGAKYLLLYSDPQDVTSK